MSVNLVTGGAGFVGRYLVRSLLEKGETVRVLDVNLASLKGTAAELIHGSITNKRDTSNACKGVKTVFHLAGNAQLWAPESSIFETVNHHGTDVMLRAAKAEGVQQFIHCSSLTTLIGKDTPIGPSIADESIWLDPDDMLGPYPRSKRLAEEAALATVHTGTKSSMSVMIAIPTEPLGAEDDSLTPPTQMILDFVNGKTPAYIDCILNFVPVSALANGFIAIRDRGINGERYLLAGENVDMKTLLDKLNKQTKKPMPSLKMPYAVALAAGVVDTGIVSRLTGKQPKAPLTGVRLAGRQVSFSNKKACTELGWNPGDVDHALSTMLNWAKDNKLIQV